MCRFIPPRHRAVRRMLYMPNDHTGNAADQAGVNREAHRRTSYSRNLPSAAGIKHRASPTSLTQCPGLSPVARPGFHQMPFHEWHLGNQQPRRATDERHGLRPPPGACDGRALAEPRPKFRLPRHSSSLPSGRSPTLQACVIHRDLPWTRSQAALGWATLGAVWRPASWNAF